MSANIALILKLSVGVVLAIFTVFNCWPLILKHLKGWLEKPLKGGFLKGFSSKILLYFGLPLVLVLSGSLQALITIRKIREFFPMTKFMKGGPYEFPSGNELSILPEVSWVLLCVMIGTILVICASRILAQLYDKFPVDVMLLSILGLLSSFIVAGFVDDRYYTLLSDFILAPAYYPWWIITFVIITIVAGLCTELLLLNKEKKQMP